MLSRVHPIVPEHGVPKKNVNVGGCCSRMKRRLQLPSDSKWWLVPHLLGFLCYILDVKETLNFAEVNESIRAASSYIDQTNNAFVDILDHYDLWEFLENNVARAVTKRIHTDYNGKIFDFFSQDLSMKPDVTMPVVFAPLTIEQKRYDQNPLCAGVDMGANVEEYHTLLGLGVDCNPQTILPFGFMRIPPFFNSTELCPPWVALNQTHNPFQVTKSTIEDPADMTKANDVYSIQNVSPYLPPYDVAAVFTRLRECYWIDSLTREVTLSIPFMVKPTKVFGNLRYQVSYSVTGSVTAKSHKVTYARHLTTGEELSTPTKKPGESDRRAYIMVLRLVFSWYFVIEFFMRNWGLVKSTYRWGKDNKKSTADVFLKMLSACFLNKMFYTNLFLLASANLVEYIMIPGVNSAVENIYKMLASLGSGESTFDGKFAEEFSQHINDGDYWMWTYTMFICWCLWVWLIKLLNVFDHAADVNIVPKTLFRSLPHLFNLVIVMMAIIGIYGTMCMAVYGHVIERWSNPSEVVRQVYIMMLGDWSDQLAEMYEVDPIPSVVMFLFFSIVLLITVLNIFLAIIMDVYAEVKGENDAHSSPPNGADIEKKIIELKNLRSADINMNATSAVQQSDPVKYEAQYDFDAEDHEELDFQVGDVILVSDDSCNHGSDWRSGRNTRTGKTGIFPKNYCTRSIV